MEQTMKLIIDGFPVDVYHGVEIDVEPNIHFVTLDVKHVRLQILKDDGYPEVKIYIKDMKKEFDEPSRLLATVEVDGGG